MPKKRPVPKPKPPRTLQELSLRPYHGRLWLARTRQTYERAHQRIFSEPDVLTCAQEGRFAAGSGKTNGLWTYLIYAEKPHSLAHELAHVVLHTFQRAGIDPREANGEPFCYLLSQLLLEANPSGQV